jgi:hypothetical protein
LIKATFDDSQRLAQFDEGWDPILINEPPVVEFHDVLLNMKHLQLFETSEIGVLINEPVVVE